MEPNKNKDAKQKYNNLRKGVFGYTIVFQMIFTIIGLALIGNYLGDYFYPDTNLDLIFTGIGVVLGFIVSIMSFVSFVKREEIYEKHRRD
ncbi:AtpZ/AtpI family protein [Mycoplasmatota bacterium]|nr:AtpZ/AtpI family protein [Mycoplasmatota bacterium]